VTTHRVGFLVLVGALLAACGGPTATTRPSPSLVTLDFTPPPVSAPPASHSPTQTPGATPLAASWPVGWDVAFCNAFADLTVAHELLIDIERAIADDNKSDAAALAGELAQTAPIAEAEVTRMTDWEVAAKLKTDLTALLDLDTQASTAYQSYFNDGVRAGLRQARQLRNQVGKQVAPINAELAQLTALGLACPGTNLTLESI
jgi:hypothetical protein